MIYIFVCFFILIKMILLYEFRMFRLMIFVFLIKLYTNRFIRCFYLHIFNIIIRSFFLRVLLHVVVWLSLEYYDFNIINTIFLIPNHSFWRFKAFLSDFNHSDFLYISVWMFKFYFKNLFILQIIWIPMDRKLI